MMAALGTLLAAAAASPAAGESVVVAPFEEALTFAVSVDGAEKRLIAVTRYDKGVVEGVDLTQDAQGGDAIDLVNRTGYDALRAAIESRSARVTVAAASLAAPARLGDAHVAVGANYRAHAEEANVKDGPFLFPKLVAPTGPRAPIPWKAGGLLDYEVELCLVALRPIGPTDKAAGGLILCNDVTDRAALLRHVDPAAPSSGKGFPEGKSAHGFLPVGDLLVVPRDLGAFARSLTLSLSVNGKVRQDARADLWVWDFDRILNEARARRGEVWPYWSKTAALPFAADGSLPERTLILAGTPAGTIFESFAWTDYAGGVWRWLTSGMKGPVARAVIETYIARQTRAKAYLQPGDVVAIRVDRMGTLVNTVR
ncbi:MAG: fumarylacetoacetate hydrolase family protein [Parvularculaceae bacterium]|nr:fumarylacetoacetate hydrolase family protein [Parvularculaceae bacterium]